MSPEKETIEEVKTEEVKVEDIEAEKEAEGTVPLQPILESLLMRFNRGEEMIRHGSSAPTHIPKTFFEQFYLYESNSTRRLYVYINETWISLATVNTALYVKKDGTIAFTGEQSMGTHKLIDVVDPTANQDAATKKYVDDEITALVLIKKLLGDSSDGNVVIDASSDSYDFGSLVGNIFTASADIHAENLTVDSDYVLDLNGFRIYARGKLLNNGTIRSNGGSGGHGGDGTDGQWPGDAGAGGSAGATGAAAHAGGSLPDSKAGKAGTTGAPGGRDQASGGASPAGDNGDNVTRSLGADGKAGVRGGKGGNADIWSGDNGGIPGTAGTITAIVNVLWWILHILKFWDVDDDGTINQITGSAQTGGSTGGGSGAAAVNSEGGGGGGGGGSGAPGGTVLICANEIENNGTIESNGGNGGNGGSAGAGYGTEAGGGAGGSGGSGGSGGVIYLFYIESYTNNGTVQATGGSLGTWGSGGAGVGGGEAGGPGVNGNNGGVGTVTTNQL